MLLSSEVNNGNWRRSCWNRYRRSQQEVLELLDLLFLVEHVDMQILEIRQQISRGPQEYAVWVSKL